MSVFQFLCLLYRTYLLFYLFYLCSCFNLETRLPITKFGRNNGSYFGFSVASHRTVLPQQAEEHSWLLVGAPLDQNLQPGTNHSGALYKCPLTTRTDDCEQVVTDGKRIIDASELHPPLEDEIKDGQWLGVSLQSQGPGGKIIVCAHRYVFQGPDFRWALGLCYTLTQNLEYDSCFEPCKGVSQPYKLETFGYCQAGTSSFIFEEEAIIGIPGPTTMRGFIYANTVSDEYLKRDQTKYYSPYTFVEKYSYLGMSVTAARFYDEHQISYAAGAPRSNDTGQVILFSKTQKKAQKERGLLDVKDILTGEQIGSNFGYQLVAADVNGDGKPDLIVGAPFYFTKDAGGAVYIYLNENYCLNCTAPTKLTGKPESRFGFALSNLGDLNKDGFDDIAVGAPYQGNGVVYIYLGSKNGLDTEPAQIIESESVATPRPLTTFGYSLSPGMDLDQNNYPDLLIGAYESEAVVLLKARPIIQIITNVGPEYGLKNIDVTKVGCNDDPKANYTCFTFDACCKIEPLDIKSFRTSQLSLKYRLEAETFASNQKFSRIFFGSAQNDKNHIVEGTVEVKPGSNRCDKHTAYIKENTKDIQSPIKMKLSYSLVQREPRKIKPGQEAQSVDEFPILNKRQADRLFQATFHKDCGDNDVCEARLFVEAELQLKGVNVGFYELILGQHQEVVLSITTRNLGESAYEAHVYISHHVKLSYIGVVKGEGKQLLCNPHNQTMVVCTLGNPFRSDATNNLKLRFDPHALGEEPDLEFTIFANSTSKDAEKQSPLVLRAVIVRKAELSIRGTARPEQVFYGGEVKPVYSILYLDEVGTRIMHNYQVFNAGPWRVSHLEVHIDWPFQVASNKANGKQLLYIEDVPEVEALGGGQCTVQSDVNPLNLYQRPGFLEMPFDYVRPSKDVPLPSSNATHRVRREISKMIVRSETYTDKDGKKRKIVNMDCLLITAKCFKIICNIYNLQPNHEATIFIKARLWNSTLVEDYPHVDLITIASRAKIHIPESLFLKQNTSNDEAEVKTIAIKDLAQEVSTISWWVILLAILLGLLLLILVTFCLWKLGFFKRRRYDPTLSGNIEKHGDDDYSDDDNF